MNNFSEEYSPITRLLDLTLGWAEYVHHIQDEHHDIRLSADDLYDLYQEAGQLAAEPLTEDEERRRVREFLETRLLPILLDGRKVQPKELSPLKAA